MPDNTIVDTQIVVLGIGVRDRIQIMYNTAIHYTGMYVVLK